MSVECGDCGELLAESSSDPPLPDQPCPECGSLRRNFRLKAETGQLKITGHPVTISIRSVKEYYEHHPWRLTGGVAGVAASTVAGTVIAGTVGLVAGAVISLVGLVVLPPWREKHRDERIESR